MSSKVQLIKEEIERRINACEKYSRLNLTGSTRIGNHAQLLELREIKEFIDSLPEESGREIGLTAENENKMFEEIDRYCTLCMDINCFGCKYHDIHFRDIFKDGTIH